MYSLRDKFCSLKTKNISLPESFVVFSFQSKLWYSKQLILYCLLAKLRIITFQLPNS